MSIIQLALENKREELITALECGANVNEQNMQDKMSQKETSLYLASHNNYTDTIRILLQHKNIQVNLGNHTTMTPLHIACLNEQKEAIELLLQDARVDVNATDDNGWTPLMTACYFGKMASVYMLLASPRYIDVERKITKVEIFGTIKRTKHTISAIDVAKTSTFNYQCKEEIKNLLKEYKLNPVDTQQKLRDKFDFKEASMTNKLLFACSEGEVKEVKRLLSSGLDVNTCDQYGHSLVWIACYLNHPDVVKLLIQYPRLTENKDKLAQSMLCIFQTYNEATKYFMSYYNRS